MYHLVQVQSSQLPLQTYWPMLNRLPIDRTKVDAEFKGLVNVYHFPKVLVRLNIVTWETAPSLLVVQRKSGGRKGYGYTRLFSQMYHSNRKVHI